MTLNFLMNILHIWDNWNIWAWNITKIFVYQLEIHPLLEVVIISLSFVFIGNRNVPSHSSFVLFEKYNGNVKDKSFSISSICCKRFVDLFFIAWHWIGDKRLFFTCQSLSHVFKSLWLKNSLQTASIGPMIIPISKCVNKWHSLIQNLYIDIFKLLDFATYTLI